MKKPKKYAEVKLGLLAHIIKELPKYGDKQCRGLLCEFRQVPDDPTDPLSSYHRERFFCVQGAVFDILSKKLPNNGHWTKMDDGSEGSGALDELNSSLGNVISGYLQTKTGVPAKRWSFLLERNDSTGTKHYTIEKCVSYLKRILTAARKERNR